jgi:hypothetical protein
MIGQLIRNRHLLITCDERAVSCSIIAPSSGIAPYHLVAYQRFPLNHHEIMHLRLFNISKISHHIAAFIKAHQAHHAFVSCALTGSGITELIMREPEPTISATQLMQQAPDPLIWDSCYLYPNDNALHTFYACGISRELLLQYNLMARMTSLSLNILTSTWYAHLQLYKAMQGPAFRRVNLAQTLTAHHHRWHDLLPRDMLYRMIAIPSAYKHEDELPFIRTALGLFIMGNTHG